MMTAAERFKHVTVEEYLAQEASSDTKHEFLGGYVYAMAGGTVAHNRIATNCTVSLGASLRGRPCRPFNSDMKIRIKLPTHTRFYYPDVSVICESNPPDDPHQDHPVVIIEVLSRDTRRTDEGEKRDAYFAIPSLHAYLLVEQSLSHVTVFRRKEQGFLPEVYSGVDEVIPLPEIGAELPLRDVYEGIEFIPESVEHET